jgi:hypothetical protein
MSLGMNAPPPHRLGHSRYHLPAVVLRHQLQEHLLAAVRADGVEVRFGQWYPDGRIFGIAPLPGARTYFYCTALLGRWPQTLHGSLDQWIAS